MEWAFCGLSSMRLIACMYYVVSLMPCVAVVLAQSWAVFFPDFADVKLLFLDHWGGCQKKIW